MEQSVDSASTPGLDGAAVQDWLLAHVAGLRPPLRFSVIAGGHSNITYGIVDAAERRLVLRRPPLGTLPPGAHDVGREYRIITALAPTAVPVPPTRGLCTDADVTGAPFYVMDWMDGAVAMNPAAVDDHLPDVAARQRVSLEIADVLAALHLVDVDAVGLGDLGRREAYLERQLHRMIGVWERTRTRDLPVIEDVHRRLSVTIPAQRYTGLVHADFRLGNVMVAPEGTITAVLDWELCALGDVLVDVGFLLNSWQVPDDPPHNVWMEIPPTRAGGFADRGELIERYAQRTGFDVTDLDYYQAFAHWRMAIIAEGIKRRYESAAMGTADVDFGHLERRVGQMAALADEHLRACGR